MNRLRKTAGEGETRVYEVNGSPEILDQLEELLKCVEYLGDIGASRNIQFFVDGDGSARLKFNRTDSKEKMKSKKVDKDNQPIKDFGLC